MPDDVGGGRPKLVVLAYDAVTIGTAEDIPALVRRIYLRKGSDGSALRLLRNNIVFVVADDARKAEMRRHASRRLALRELKKPERLAHLAEHQRDKVCELEARSEQELALAIQQCYRHVFYPSRHRVESADVDLAHSAIDTHSTSDQPGAGQQHIARLLADLNKLRYPEDEPDSPTYVRDRTPLKKGEMTTLGLRNEFRRDPGLPMLIGDDVFVRGVRLGVEQGSTSTVAAICCSARGSVGGDRARRAVGHFHHGVRQEPGNLAAAGAGCARDRSCRFAPRQCRRRRFVVHPYVWFQPGQGRGRTAVW